MIDLNEACFVKVEETSGLEDNEVKLRVTNLWIGWPKEHKSFKEPAQIPYEDRHKFLLFLEAHNLAINDFLNVIHGEKAPRYYLV